MPELTPHERDLARRRPYMREYMRKNRVRKYGISPKELEALLEKQKGKCAICGDPPGKKALCVDHDHSSGRLRGLLCTRCNQGLGYFLDSPDLLGRAAKYLAQVQVQN